MNWLKNIVDIFLHIDEHLAELINTMGIWVYLLIFAIIFMETGLVVTPFLPGDSLLFAAGALASLDSLAIWPLYIIILIAAVLGDTVNYWIGKFIGPRAFKMNNRFMKKEYLEKAQQFYEKHGPKAIVLARFVPIVRTFAPFVAGIGVMNYSKFISYNIIGGFLWVTIFVWSGYFFGNVPFIKENFHYTVVLIIVLSLIPIAYEFWKGRQEKVSGQKELEPKAVKKGGKLTTTGEK